MGLRPSMVVRLAGDEARKRGFLSAGTPRIEREEADCEGIDGGRWRRGVGSGKSEGIPRKIFGAAAAGRDKPPMF